MFLRFAFSVSALRRFLRPRRLAVKWAFRSRASRALAFAFASTPSLVGPRSPRARAWLPKWVLSAFLRFPELKVLSSCREEEARAAERFLSLNYFLLAREKAPSLRVLGRPSRPSRSPTARRSLREEQDRVSARVEQIRRITMRPVRGGAMRSRSSGRMTYSSPSSPARARGPVGGSRQTHRVSRASEASSLLSVSKALFTCVCERAVGARGGVLALLGKRAPGWAGWGGSLLSSSALARLFKFSLLSLGESVALPAGGNPRRVQIACWELAGDRGSVNLVCFFAFKTQFLRGRSG